jgi:hypothetical protein
MVEQLTAYDVRILFKVFSFQQRRRVPRLDVVCVSADRSRGRRYARNQPPIAQRLARDPGKECRLSAELDKAGSHPTRRTHTRPYRS